MKKRLIAVLLSMLLILALLPTTALAASGLKTFSFIGGETTQEEVDAAWGAGVVSYTSQEVDGKMVYTIKLLDDIEMAAGNDVRIGEYRADGPAPVQMVLDLNSHMITSSSIGLINYCDLIIRDTSEAKTGCIKYSTTNDKSSLVTISHKGGLLVIEDGTFICESGYAFTGYVAAVSTQAGASTQIKGGTFISNSSAVLSSGETTVYGGTFEAPYGMYAKSADGVPGTITIPEESTAVVNASSFAMVIQRDGETDGVIHAAGGTYDAPKVVGGVKGPDTKEAVTITGGTYSENPLSWVPEDTAVASVTEQGEPVSYLVGADDIEKAAAGAAAGDRIEVLSGSVSLTGVPDGVEVANSGGKEVSVNGDPVADNGTVTVCNHIWGDPVWNWENTSKATATFTCEKNADHKEMVSAGITSKITKPATCTENGVTTYTAKAIFQDEEYTDQKEAADIPATGHSYEDGVCTVCGEPDPEFSPVIIAGADSTWQKGSDSGLSFTSNAAFADFLGVQVDGKDVDQSNYEKEEGSTVVTLKAAYLETLAEGEHDFAIVSKTGIAATQFTVLAAAEGEQGATQTPDGDSDTDKPGTDDSANLILWVSLLLVSGAGVFGAIYKRKNRA